MENNVEKNDTAKSAPKKKNIFLYFVGMFFVFVIIFMIQQGMADFFANSISSIKYGEETLFEIIWAGLVLVVLLLFKNKYVFTQENESFSKSIKYILPELLISCVFFGYSIYKLATSTEPFALNPLTILNLLVFCFFIGIVEEFLCRGWLFNEFLERFSDSKKSKMLCILLSSLVFGIMHYVNLGPTQGFIDTTFQVINAFVTGVFLTLVYYKTKNIWVCVFSHAVWDFCLFLAESRTMVDCYIEGSAPAGYLGYTIIVGVLSMSGYLLICNWLYRQTDLYEPKKEKHSPMTVMMLAGVVLYLAGVYLVPVPKEYDKYYICPVYPAKEVSTEYSWTNSLVSDYRLTFNKEANSIDSDGKVVPGTTTFDFTLTVNGKTGQVELKNNIIDKKVELWDLSTMYSPTYLLIENEKDFIILIQTDDNVVAYGRFEKSRVVNTTDYLDFVKNNLKEYHVPDIQLLNSLKFVDDDYTYASIKTNLGERMMFDQNDELVILDIQFE